MPRDEAGNCLIDKRELVEEIKARKEGYEISMEIPANVAVRLDNMMI